MSRPIGPISRPTRKCSSRHSVPPSPRPVAIRIEAPPTMSRWPTTSCAVWASPTLTSSLGRHLPHLPHLPPCTSTHSTHLNTHITWIQTAARRRTLLQHLSPHHIDPRTVTPPPAPARAWSTVQPHPLQPVWWAPPPRCTPCKSTFSTSFVTLSLY